MKKFFAGIFFLLGWLALPLAGADISGQCWVDQLWFSTGAVLVFAICMLAAAELMRSHINGRHCRFIAGGLPTQK